METISSGDRSESEDAGRFRLGSIAPWVLFGIIFAIEFTGSLRVWRASGTDNVLLAGLCSLVLLALLWAGFLLVAGVYSWFLRRLSFSGRPLIFRGLRLFAAAVVSAGWVFIVLDLAALRALGCFLNPSLVRFAIANLSNGFWAHTAAEYRWMLAVAALFLGVTTPIVFLKTWQNAPRLNIVGNPELRRPLLAASLVIVCAFTFSTVAINKSENKELRTRIVRHLCYKVEPLLAFSLGCADVYREMHDENTMLDETALIPRSQAFAPPGSLADKPNIIFFQIESCRPDLIDMVHQGIEVTPNLNRLAHAGTRFTKAYAPGTHTSLSNVSIPTSLCALRSPMLALYHANDPQPRTLIFDVLKPLGYDTAWVSSDFEYWSGMSEYILTSNLDVFIDAAIMQQTKPIPALIPGGNLVLEPDTETFAQATDFISGELQKKRPFYLTLSLSDSHFPYDSSIHTNWFQPCGVPESCSIFDYPESATNQIRNSYLNSIRGVDVLLGRLMTFLHERGADDHTIIVVYGDHGESFYENHVLSHGNLPYDPSARTTLVMYGKGYFTSRVEDYPTSLIDVVPTVLAQIGVPHHPNFQGTDVLAPSRPAPESRAVYIHVDGLVNGDGLVAGGRWKYISDNGSGASYLYDLANDPGELHNLVSSQPDLADMLARKLDSYCAGQLAYYRLPHYYKHFYPPAPPQFEMPYESAQQTQATQAAPSL